MYKLIKTLRNFPTLCKASNYELFIVDFILLDQISSLGFKMSVWNILFFLKREYET